MTTLHPRLNDDGKPVAILRPSTPTQPATWTEPHAVAIFVPDGPMPFVLNGVAVAPWSPPASVDAWERLAGGVTLIEPPFASPGTLEPAAGAVVVESDGRCWCIAPTGGFGGHSHVFPKGRTDGRSLA